MYFSYFREITNTLRVWLSKRIPTMWIVVLYMPCGSFHSNYIVHLHRVENLEPFVVRLLRHHWHTYFCVTTVVVSNAVIWFEERGKGDLLFWSIPIKYSGGRNANGRPQVGLKPYQGFITHVNRWQWPLTTRCATCSHATPFFFWYNTHEAIPMVIWFVLSRILIFLL